MVLEVQEIDNKPSIDGSCALRSYFGMAISSDGMRYTRSSGETRDGSAVDGRSIFRIASLTKILTSIGVMQLVERGKLGLDDRVDGYLSSIAKVMVLDVKADNTKVFRAPKSPITFRHLLTHTAGFAYDFTHKHAAKYREDRDSGETGVCLLSDPGERWLYGQSTEWLGRVLEEITGDPLDVYFRTYITGPLDMPDTDFSVADGRRGALIDVHQWSEPGRITKDEARSKIESNTPVGDGGLFSTGDDYGKILRLFLCPQADSDSNILSSRWIEYMCRNQIGTMEVTAIKSVLPAYSSDFTFIDEGFDKWSLAFLVAGRRRGPRTRAAGSLSWGGAFNTHVWIDRGEGVAGLFFTQMLPFANPVALAALNSFEGNAYIAATDYRGSRRRFALGGDTRVRTH